MQRIVALVLARLQEQAGKEHLVEPEALLQSMLQTLLLTLRPEESAELQQKLPVRQVASTSISSTHAESAHLRYWLLPICEITLCEPTKHCVETAWAQ